MGRLLLGIVLVIVACAILWRWRGRRSRSVAVAGRKKWLHHAELSRVEALLAELGFVRAPSETLTQFVRRVDAAAGREPWFRPVADWYGLYVASRYRGGEDAPSAPRFEAAIQPLLSAVRNSRRRSRSSPIQEQP
ncbi:MAG: DUF4129 domain-containing protein [Maioricimonas sp. JB049]